MPKINAPSETDCLLAAASKLPAEFTEWDLTFRAWLIAPQRFGMKGYREKFPDHKRVFVAFYATHGVIKAGLMERVRPNTYRLTPAGKAAAAKLPAGLLMENVAG